MKQFLLILAGSMVLATGIYTHQAGADAIQAYDNAELTNIVNYHKSLLDNHEARITNLENDASTLQSNTDTSPSVTRVEVPAQNNIQPSQPPQPQPIVVTSYEIMSIENSQDKDCKLTYSDSTTYQWHWKTVEYNQGTKITHTDAKCDSSRIGESKN